MPSRTLAARRSPLDDAHAAAGLRLHQVEHRTVAPTEMAQERLPWKDKPPTTSWWVADPLNAGLRELTTAREHRGRPVIMRRRLPWETNQFPHLH